VFTYNTMDATSGTGTAYPSGAPYFTPRFCWGFFWGGEEGVQFSYTLVF